MGCSDCNDCQGLAKSYPAGPEGPPGADGAPGVPGTPGTPGTPGIDGLNGTGYDTEFCNSEDQPDGSGIGSGFGNWSILPSYNLTVTTAGNYDLFFNAEMVLQDKQGTGGNIGQAGLCFYIDDGGGPVNIADSIREMKYDDCYSSDACDSEIQWPAGLLACSVSLNIGDVVGIRGWEDNGNILRATALYKLNTIASGTFNIIAPNNDGNMVPAPGPSWKVGDFSGPSVVPPLRVGTGDKMFWFDKITCALPMTMTLTTSHGNITNIQWGSTGSDVYIAGGAWSVLTLDSPTVLQIVQQAETFDFTITFESCGTTKILTGPFEIT